MGYYEIANMSENRELSIRVQACVTQESADANLNVYQWTANNMLRLCSTPGWDAAWSDAVAADISVPGRDPQVIDDSMVLAAVRQQLGATAKRH